MSKKPVLLSLCVVLTLAAAAMAVTLGEDAPAQDPMTPVQQGAAMLTNAFWAEPSIMVLLGVGALAIAPSRIKKYRRQKHA